MVGRSLSLTFSPGRTRKYFELIFIFVPFRNVRVVRVSSFMGFVFPKLPLRLVPVLNCSPVLAASLLVQCIGFFFFQGGGVNRFPPLSLKNAPSDHRDLHGV